MSRYSYSELNIRQSLSITQSSSRSAFFDRSDFSSLFVSLWLQQNCHNQLSLLTISLNEILLYVGTPQMKKLHSGYIKVHRSEHSRDQCSIHSAQDENGFHQIWIKAFNIFFKDVYFIRSIVENFWNKTILTLQFLFIQYLIYSQWNCWKYHQIIFWSLLCLFHIIKKSFLNIHLLTYFAFVYLFNSHWAEKSVCFSKQHINIFILTLQVEFSVCLNMFEWQNRLLVKELRKKVCSIFSHIQSRTLCILCILELYRLLFSYSLKIFEINFWFYAMIFSDQSSWITMQLLSRVVLKFSMI